MYIMLIEDQLGATTRLYRPCVHARSSDGRCISSRLSVMARVWRWAAPSAARASAGGRGLCDLKISLRRYGPIRTCRLILSSCTRFEMSIGLKLERKIKLIHLYMYMSVLCFLLLSWGCLLFWDCAFWKAFQIRPVQAM